MAPFIHQGHDGEILAAALRPAFLCRFCKEPVLEGASAGVLGRCQAR